MTKKIAMTHRLLASDILLREKCFFVMLALLGFLFAAYLVFLGVNVGNVLARSRAEGTIRQMKSDNALLESRYLALAGDLDIASGTLYGLAVPKETYFATRASFVTLSSGLPHDIK